MKLKICQAGEPVLRGRARQLTRDEILSSETQTLIRLMRATMYDAPGVGLAAPQVGVPLQIAVIEDKEEYLADIPSQILEQRERRPVAFHVIINPVITLGHSTVEHFEGCLSVNGCTALVARAREVTVDCLNELGEPVHIEASGWYARILQHEIDHLHGTLYIDRMEARTFATAENYSRYWKNLTIEEVKRLAGE